METNVSVVTGVTGYTGKYIAKRLLAKGERVRSLTNHLDRENPFGGQIEMYPYNFEDKTALTKSLEGATTLYNTYWVRFSHGQVTYDLAVRNTKILLEAAKTAGIRKVVHVSIANPDENSPLPYYSGKAALEKAVKDSGMGYAIVRPTVIFGAEDILINNIAWLLRKFPVFAVAGSGDYGIQPIFVEDMADLCVSFAGHQENVIADAVGPEKFSFTGLVRLIKKKDAQPRQDRSRLSRCVARRFAFGGVVHRRRYLDSRRDPRADGERPGLFRSADGKYPFY